MNTRYSRCALCVIKSAIRHGMKFTWKYPNVLGLFLDGIAVKSQEAGKRSTMGYKSQPVVYDPSDRPAPGATLHGLFSNI